MIRNVTLIHKTEIDNLKKLHERKNITQKKAYVKQLDLMNKQILLLQSTLSMEKDMHMKN
jgi:hypothetical protein